MQRWFQLPRPLLLAVATLFAAAAILYGSLWMYDARHRSSRVELGFNKTVNQNPYDEKTHSMAVRDVAPGSPAETAGLRANDRIVAINGRPLDSTAPFDETYALARPGDAVEVTVEREGEPRPLVLHGVFRASSPGKAQEGLARSSALEIARSFHVLFLVVGFAVLFLRVDDPNAWLLASLFCAFVAAPTFSNPLAMNPALRAFAFAYRAVFFGMLCPLFYVFFAVFPARSPVDRRFPWLKWLGLAFGVWLVVPGLRVGDIKMPGAVAQLVGERAAEMILNSVEYSLITLGLISLGGNAFGSAAAPDVRRKSRVILWGTVFGVVPIIIERAAIDFTGYRPSFWVDTGLILVLLLYPLSFAYAVVRHRVMEIPALLRRSARYVLVQRGFIVLLFVAAAAAIVLFTHTFNRFFQTDSNVGMTLSAIFGIVLIWASAPLVKRGTERIDRAFFRSAYDARVILQDLAEKARTVSDRRQLATLLERHISEALHPKTLACYLEAGDLRLAAMCGAVSANLETIPASAPVLAELVRRGKSWDVPPGSANAEEFWVLAPLEVECLVPILGRENRLIGMLALGQRLSEEPYSGEDRHLLDSVAGQAGIALESIRLAEQIAERMEAERRSLREVEMARQVQARLFPQKLPSLRTLEYAGRCIQARQVGGDYYDFLELAPGRLGLLLADIAGKGFSGALLMANLQANLRSQYAAALEDLPRLLESVNRLFYENTADEAYATLFFTDYEDATGHMRYANCGHVSPLLLRADGTPEWLESTCTVLGLFEKWQCGLGQVELASKDTLVVYSDGVTEAAGADGEEFGQVRLLETVRANKEMAVSSLLEAIVAAVQNYSGQEQADDLTLVVARRR